MSYTITTKINDVVKTCKTFGGAIPKRTVTTRKPCRAMDSNYYYFIIENNPIRAKSTDVMTIEAENITRILNNG